MKRKGRIINKTESKKPTLYTNDTLSQEFKKNDCGKGYIGSTSVYYVTKGTHIASTKEEANLLAKQDLEKNGQNYANANGVCTSITEPTVLKADVFNAVTEQVEPNYITFKNKVPKKIKNKDFMLVVDIMVGTKYIAEGLVISASESELTFPYINPENKSLRVDIQKFIYKDELVGEFCLSKVTPDDENSRVTNLFGTSPQSMYWSINPGDVTIEVKYNAHKQPTIEFLGGWRDCDGVEMRISSSTYVPDFVQDYPLGFIQKQWQNKGTLISPDLREIGNKMRDVEIALIPVSNAFEDFDFTQLQSNVGEVEQIGNIGIITISQLSLDTDVKIEFYIEGKL